ANNYVLTFDTAVLFKIISNVPAGFGLKPLFVGLCRPHPVWVGVWVRGTLGGHPNPGRSIADPIRVGTARAPRLPLSLWAYCRAGIPITLATLALGAWWLS